MNQASAVHSKAITLGFWSALITAIFSTLFVISTFVFLGPGWTDIQSYAKSFSTLQLLPVIPCVIFALAVIVLMVSLHYYLPEDKRIYSLIAIALTIIYVTIISINAYLQLFVVRLNLLQGQLEGLAILAMPNTRSVFFALEAIGYGFLSAAGLAISPVFTGGRLAQWIRGLFIVNGVLGIYGVVIAPFDRPMLIMAGLGGWMLLFPISMVLMCLFFRNAGLQIRRNLHSA